MNSFNLNFQGLEYIGMISIPILAVLLSIIIECFLYRKRILSEISWRLLIYHLTLVFFYLLFIQMIRFNVLELKPLLPKWVSYVGVILVYLGCLTSINVRYYQFDNWKKQKQNKDVSIPLTTGIFRYIRRPLDTSLFVILFGVALIFSNIACFLLIAFILIPFRTYMVKQEEQILLEEDPKYGAYKVKTGLYFPKIKK